MSSSRRRWRAKRPVAARSALPLLVCSRRGPRRNSPSSVRTQISGQEMRVCRLLLPRVVAPARPALVNHARRLVSNKEGMRGNFRCGWWGARACWSPKHPLTPPLPHPALARSPPLRLVGASAPRRGRRCAMPSARCALCCSAMRQTARTGSNLAQAGRVALARALPQPNAP